MASFLISDLHLHPERPATLEAFSAFLKHTANGAEALYILGDFFDVWLGDDDDTAAYQTVKAQLRDYSDTGTQLFLMHGNRDFLLGETFCQQVGATLLPDPTLTVIAGHQVLLMHGDSLCTRDEAYMAFREQVRDPNWQRQMLAKPLAERRAYAAKAREHSQTQNSLKAEDIMDVTPSEVEKVMADYSVATLIHGHTHRPKRHQLKADWLDQNQQGERIVLGEWDKQGWYIKIDSAAIELETFSLSK